MKLLAVAWFALATSCLALTGGCLWANQRSEAVYGYEARAVLRDDGHVEGAALRADGGYAGVTVGAESDLRDGQRAGDPHTYKTAGLGLILRASLLGIIATEHRFERYFDIGADVGAAGSVMFGVPPHHIAGGGSAWYGAWTEIGTFSAGSGYVALTGSIRREAATSPWLSQTIVTVGLAWRHRRLVTGEDLRWRD